MKHFYALLFILPFIASAQDSLYSKVFYDTTFQMEAFSADNTLDSGLIVAGRFQSNAFVMRLDSLGNELWQTSFDVSGNSSHFTDVISTIDSGFVAVGANIFRAYIAKFDQYGDTLWTKYLGEPGNNFAERTFVTETLDSGYMVTWGNFNENRFYLSKLSSSGTIEWSYNMDGSSSSVPSFIKQAADSNIYIGGASGWNNGNLIKLTNGGQVVWAQEIGGGPVEDLVFVDSNLYVITANYNYSSPTVIKMDTSANIAWSYFYPGAWLDGSNMNMHVRMYLAEDSSLVFQTPSQMVANNVVSRIDKDGQLLSITGQDLGGMDVLPAANNGAFIIGIGPTYGIKVWTPQFAVIRVDSNLLGTSCSFVGWMGSVDTLSLGVSPVTFTPNGPVIIDPSLPSALTPIEYYTYQGCVDFIGSIEEIELDVKVFPNVSSGIFNFNIENSGSFELKIFDLSGEELVSDKFNWSNYQLDLSDLQSGSYQYMIREKDSGLTKSGRLILAK